MKIKLKEIFFKTFLPKGKKLLTREDIKEISKIYKLDYQKVTKYLLNEGIAITIFRGIYYLKSPDEIELTIKLSNPELIALGLEKKGIKHWYFGLYTSLVYHNIIAQIPKKIFVLNSKIHREIMMNKQLFKFIKLKKPFRLGIIKHKTKNKIVLRYSDLEKTVLDFLYLGAGKRRQRQKTIWVLRENLEKISKKKLFNYLKHYPQTVKHLVKNEYQRK